MPRIYIDLYFIPADNLDKALSLLIDSGLITCHEFDVRFSDLNMVKCQFPDHGAFLEVKSFY